MCMSCSGADPGAIVLHDVMMTDFYLWYAGVTRPDDPAPRTG